MEMNRDLLQKLLESYIDKYEQMNDAEHHELYKWDAVSHFQKYWDVDADDFGNMFKKALANAENLIDDNVMAPGKGIVFLCERGEEDMEKVRASFKNLIVNDHSDYDLRQEKIDTFVEEINHQLEKLGCEEWKFRQNTRAVIMYLSFIDPDDNYMFKESEVKSFASYIRYTGKIGSGKSFSLQSYYKMCDGVLEELQENADLLDMVNNRLEAEAELTGNTGICDIDAENHILVYDLIYAAGNYDFYDEIQAKTTRAYTVTALKNDEKEAQRLKLENGKASMETELKMAKAEREGLLFPDLQGKTARHKKFGQGEIVEQSEQYLKVKFGVGTKKFLLPGAIVQGFLTIDDESMAATLQHMDELDKKIDRVSLEIKMIELEIAGIK